MHRLLFDKMHERARCICLRVNVECYMDRALKRLNRTSSDITAALIIFPKLETLFNTHYQYKCTNVFRNAFFKLLRVEKALSPCSCIAEGKNGFQND